MTNCEESVKIYTYVHTISEQTVKNKFNDELMKRESGESPERSRHCDSGTESRCHWEYREGAKVWRLKSGDLLVLVRKNSCGRRECSYLDISISEKGRVIYKG